MILTCPHVLLRRRRVGIQEFTDADSFGSVVNSILVGVTGISSVIGEASSGTFPTSWWFHAKIGLHRF